MNRTTGIIAGVIAALVIIGGGAYFAWGNFTQASQASAEAMPVDTPLYVSVDVINLRDREKVGRIADIFEKYSADAPDANPMDTVQSELLDELDMTFEDDIVPWVGRTAGMGIFNIEQGLDDAEADFIIAIQVRDNGEADSFLGKVESNYPNTENGNPFTKESYNGTTYLLEQQSAQEQPLVLGRSDSLMLVSTSQALMENAIDARKGENLLSNETYTKLTAELPEERAMTFFMGKDGFEEFLDAAQAQSTVGVNFDSAMESANLDAFEGVAGSIGLANDGIQMDYVSETDSTKLSESQKSLLDAQKAFSGQMASKVPSDTLLYLSSAGLASVWESQKETLLETGGEDFEDSLTLAEEQLGFSIDNFLGQMTGEMALVVTPAESGLFSEMAEANVGVTLLHGVDDPQAMNDILQQIVTLATDFGFPLETTASGGFDLFTASMFSEAPAFGLGLNNDMFALTTAPEAIGGFSDGVLLSSGEFNSAQSALTTAEHINFYMNISDLPTYIPQLVDMAQTEDLPALWEDFDTMAGGSSYEGDLTHGQIILTLTDQ